MRIASLEYSLKGRALDIFVSGCVTKCKGCHNPELQDFGAGKLFDEEILTQIKHKVLSANDLVQCVRVMGGEPLHRHNIKDVLKMCSALKDTKPSLDIIIFTGYEPKDTSLRLYDTDENYYMYIDYVKTGKYIENYDSKVITLKGRKLVLASSNQEMWDSILLAEKYDIGI